MDNVLDFKPLAAMTVIESFLPENSSRSNGAQLWVAAVEEK